MALQFAFNRFQFGPLTGSVATDHKTFQSQGGVVNVLAAISSFKFQFSTSTAPDRELQERHFGRAQIETAVDLNGNLVDLVVKAFVLRDATGDIDDPYEGFVDVQLLVKTA